MLISKTNPAGVDFHIDQLQTHLHTQLIGADYWNLSDAAKYKAYPRCHRNKTDNGYIAENYEGSGEYREVYWDDTVTAISFFGMTGSVKVGLMNEADIHLVFFANLDKLALTDKTGAVIQHRADEELRNMVQAIIGKYGYGFTYVSTDFWIENVLKEYPGSRRDDRLKYVDMHPVHCFRINLKLNYKANKSC